MIVREIKGDKLTKTVEIKNAKHLSEVTGDSYMRCWREIKERDNKYCVLSDSWLLIKD